MARQAPRIARAAALSGIGSCGHGGGHAAMPGVRGMAPAAFAQPSVAKSWGLGYHRVPEPEVAAMNKLLELCHVGMGVCKRWLAFIALASAVEARVSPAEGALP